MRIILLILIACFFSLSVKAERILSREKYDLIIASDTVYEFEYYELAIDFKDRKRVKEVNISYPYTIILSDSMAYVKFTAGAESYDIKNMSKQRFKIGIVVDKDTLWEYVTYYIQKMNTVDFSRVHDSLNNLISKKKGYEHIKYATSYEENFEGFSYLFSEKILKEGVGELLVIVIVNADGKVVKYDILKNTYQTISLEKIENIIKSYQLKRHFSYSGKLKFSTIIRTVKGYRDNIVMVEEY